MIGVLAKGESLDKETDTHRENNVLRKAKIRVIHSEVGECQRLLVNHQTLGERQGANSPSQPSRNQPCQHLGYTLLASRTLRENKLLLFKEGNLWCFVRAAYETYWTNAHIFSHIHISHAHIL